MIRKAILIVMALLLAIIIISPSFASDDNITPLDEEIITSEIDTQENVKLNDIEKKDTFNQKTDTNKITANNYEELLLYSRGNKPIYLNKSREYLVTEQLDVYNHNLTIYGNGATIRGTNNSTRFLYSSLSNVILDGINFKNMGNRSVNGSIAFSIDTININNCNISDSEAFYGGAFYARNGKITIKNTNFHNVSAVIGGCIYTDTMVKELKVLNSNFTNNYASADTTYLRSGAAIYNALSPEGLPTQVNNCLFINNTGHYDGTVIYSGSININNSTFIKNKGEGFDTRGGVLYTTGTYNVTNTQFINNTASLGGAICDENYNKGGEENRKRIYNVTFINNRATEGGSLFTGGDVSIKDSKFINSTSEYGGAIKGFTSTLHINNSTFINNNATNGTLNTGNTIILNSKFINNTVKSLNIISKNKTIINSTFNTIIIIKVDKKTLMLDQNITITIKLTDYYNNPLSNRKINIKLESQKIEVQTDTNGTNTLHIKATKLGTNNITAEYESTDDYQSSNTTQQFTTNKITTKFTINKIKQTQYTDNITITGKYMDTIGKNLPNTNIQLTINNNKYNIKTDKNGTFKHTTKANKIGTNNVTVSYPGNTKYETSNKTVTFNVTRKDTKITINTQNTQYMENMTISGKFTNTNNKALKNTEIQITIKTNESAKTYTNTYKTKTNENGEYKLTVKAQHIGITTIQAQYKGNTYYAPIKTRKKININKQNTKITINPIKNTQYKSNITISGKFTDKNNKILKNTKIQIIINNKNYSTKTNERGEINYSIKANKIGTNNITIIYSGNTKYSKTTTKITFNTTARPTKITINKINTTKKGKTIKITGKFTDNLGNTLKNSILKITINRKTFNVKTDINGIYSYEYKTITLGKNIITVKYMGNEKYQSKTNQTSFIVN